MRSTDVCSLTYLCSVDLFHLLLPSEFAQVALSWIRKIVATKRRCQETELKGSIYDLPAAAKKLNFLNSVSNPCLTVILVSTYLVQVQVPWKYDLLPLSYLGFQLRCQKFVTHICFLFLLFPPFSFFSQCFYSASMCVAGLLQSVLPFSALYHWVIFFCQYFTCSLCLHSFFSKAIHSTTAQSTHWDISPW